MAVLTVGVVTEVAQGERRVALDPGVVAKLAGSGRKVLIQEGAGLPSRFPDSAYAAAGARVTSRGDVLEACKVLAVIRPPNQALVSSLRAGQLLVGMLDPANHLPTVKALADRGVTSAAFDLLPRTLSRAQSMDALSSQASAAGYRAAIVAAEAFGRYLPMMITASGTATPAKVLVLGAGVAGLQAIATTRRLGAVVTGYDVRAASRREVESLGAAFLTSSVSPEEGGGGYARAMTPDEQRAQQAELASAMASFDVIITTAKVPGRRPPLLVTEETLGSLRYGSVCIDLGASDLGGNVAGSRQGEVLLTAGGVSVIGAGELASDLPTSSSQMYARNVLALIGSLVTGDDIVVDPADEIHRSVVVTHGGQVTSATIRTRMGLDPIPQGKSLTEAKAS